MVQARWDVLGHWVVETTGVLQCPFSWQAPGYLRNPYPTMSDQL